MWAVGGNLRLRYNDRPNSGLYTIYNVGGQWASIAPGNATDSRNTHVPCSVEVGLFIQRLGAWNYAILSVEIPAQ